MKRDFYDKVMNMQNLNHYKKFIFTAGLLFLFLAGNIHAQSVGDETKLFIESSFDVSNRNKIDSVLVKTSSQLYFYVEKSWWEAQFQLKKDEILKNLDSLSDEFKNNIYPKLTNLFGTERKPGIDNDEKITVVFHPMKGMEGGYFRTADGYDRLQVPGSNQREMVYISVDLLTNSNLRVALAHEFVHLVTFNQKNINFRVEEEVWLNEARAEYSATILGYDDQYNKSNLQSRVRDFIESPTDSITEWKGTKYDYSSVSLFMQYLVDHYGVNILADSLKSRYVGIESINYALERTERKDRFSEAFVNWTIANVLNDCSVGPKYCYLNKNLTNLRITPNINFLPVSGNASLSVINVTKNWSGNWQKFIGGNGELELEFLTSNGLNFIIPYIIEDKNGKYTIEFLNIDNNKRGVINISGFGTDYKSLIIIPSLQDKFSGFNGSELAHPFSYNVTIGGELPDQNPEQALIEQLLEQIEELKKQIEELKNKLGIGKEDQKYCSAINNDLYFGLSNNNEVKCLQSFLKSLGKDIYPEGLVTGYFGNLTKTAVIKFQEKYSSEILLPLGLKSGTGFVGFSTRSKINHLLNTR